ncbi:hypothetical protein [Klebsiella phage KP8]|uniref:Uncharacterized protein n=1 Tax=Klebsiella phage KP8 TaxID=2099850 RepID=A0A2P1CCG2_9CAUD|nr:hypothetical protein HWB55_gp021 [Klebsiella phage KP8]AVJ48932.1 hypothetical protein [Klebsiella phage KP8]
MHSEAVSIQDIIRKKHNLKWEGYTFIKKVVRLAYDSPDFIYVEEVESRPTILKFFNKGKHLRIGIHYNSSTNRYKVTCFII